MERRYRTSGCRRRDNEGVASKSSDCAVCGGARWVCEDHTEKAWGGASDREDACHCGGAGLPCLDCNPCDNDHPPEMPPGYQSLIDEDSTVN